MRGVLSGEPRDETQPSDIVNGAIKPFGLGESYMIGGVKLTIPKDPEEAEIYIKVHKEQFFPERDIVTSGLFDTDRRGAQSRFRIVPWPPGDDTPIGFALGYVPGFVGNPEPKPSLEELSARRGAEIEALNERKADKSGGQAVDTLGIVRGLVEDIRKKRTPEEIAADTSKVQAENDKAIGVINKLLKSLGF